jgi:hypothetical protein
VACLADIGMPVGKLSAVEHTELAGESACPRYSVCRGRKSLENVETPVGRRKRLPHKCDRGRTSYRTVGYLMPSCSR